MDINKVDSFIIANAKNLPSDKIPMIRERMINSDDSRFVVIASVELKNATTMFFISFFLGGLAVDRFMLEKVGSGIAKLLLGWLTLGIWYFIDLFTIMSQTKKYNYEKLSLVL
ncbi:MAG: TM2 domain-containing protein [Sphaerochaetaceae bacterium]|nr:TM2 domain-containing protein [Sphaerochaetaceae bacterium]